MSTTISHYCHILRQNSQPVRGQMFKRRRHSIGTFSLIEKLKMPRNIKIASWGGCSRIWATLRPRETWAWVVKCLWISWIIQRMLKTVEMNICGDNSLENMLTNYTALFRITLPGTLHPHTEGEAFFFFFFLKKTGSLDHKNVKVAKMQNSSLDCLCWIMSSTYYISLLQLWCLYLCASTVAPIPWVPDLRWPHLTRAGT